MPQLVVGLAAKLPLLVEQELVREHSPAWQRERLRLIQVVSVLPKERLAMVFLVAETPPWTCGPPLPLASFASEKLPFQVQEETAPALLAWRLAEAVVVSVA